MNRGFLFLVIIPYTFAQLMLKPIRLINVESLADLKTRLIEAGDKLVIIGFLPRACPHSLKITPMVEKLALQYSNSVVFLRVYEDHDDIYNEYKVKSVPTFVYVKKSENLSVRTGANLKALVNVIDTVRADEHILSAFNTPVPLEGVGLLYDIECYDDLKGRLAEARGKLVVLCFMPSYCALSYTMIPEVEQLAKKYQSTTAFLRIKEEHDDIYEVFGIQAVPCFIFMQNKKKLVVRSGAGIKQLTATLEAVLSGDYTSTTTTTQKPKSHLIDINSPEDLKQRLVDANNKLVVVAFMTKWCSKCETIAPKIEEMADEYYGSVVFLRISDDGSNKEIYTDNNIERVPTFWFMRNSKKLNQYEGTTYEKVRTRIELQEFLTP